MAVEQTWLSVSECIDVLQECRRAKAGGRVQAVHVQICGRGLEAHPAVGNHLVPTLVDCENVHHAQQVFYKLKRPNENSWTSLMQGYVACGEYDLALALFPEMRKDHVLPGRHTFAALLKGCAKLKDLRRGQQLHVEVATEMLENDSIIGNTLINMYVKCELLADARAIFEELPTRTIVSWNILIGGYAEQSLGEEVLKCLEYMHREGLSPDAFTCVSTLKACGILLSIDKGQESHANIVKQGYESDIFIGNALVDTYAKCGLLLEAHNTFNKLSVPDLISWTTLIVGYAEQGEGKEAHHLFEQLQQKGMCLDTVLWSAVILGYAEQGEEEEAFALFGQMQEQGVLPNKVTFLNVLKACSKVTCFRVGDRIHAQLYNAAGVNESTEATIANTLVNMYGKCGSLGHAQQLFDSTPSRNIVKWNALMTAYSHQGAVRQVIDLFERMVEQQIQPDEITFLNVLMVCCHAGLVGKGLNFFQAMSIEFGIPPSINHYNCMIDLLGRAGQLYEAVLMLRRSFSSDFVGWCILLCACQKWGDVEAGEEAFASILSLNQEHAPAFIVMSHIYADAHMWEHAKRIEAMRLGLCMSDKAKSSTALNFEAGDLIGNNSFSASLMSLTERKKGFLLI